MILRSEYARPHFRWDELRCRGCDGSCTYSVGGKPLANPTDRALDKLEALRGLMGPLHLNSASRCPLHNARVGGAPLSQHRATQTIQSTAFDIMLRPGLDKWELIRAAEEVGFGGIGVNYRSFVHVDDRGHKARW